MAKLRGKRPREKELSVERLANKELRWLVGCYAGDGSRYFRPNAYSYEVKFALSEEEYPIVEFHGAVSSMGWPKEVYFSEIGPPLHASDGVLI